MKNELKKNYSFNLKNYFKVLFLILFMFISGVIFERFDIRNVIKYKSDYLYHEVLNEFSSSIFSRFVEKNKLIIDIKYDNYNKILKSRELSLQKGRATEDIHKWVSAKLNIDKKNYKIKIKLKGVHADHWQDPLKWSFSVKLDENKSILGLQRFSIQRASTRDFLNEWLFMQALRKEGLIYHRSNYFNVVLNGNNLGLYYLEEVYSKQLIENNSRREGPIIGLNKNLWIEEANNLQNLSINSLDQSFWRAKIEPIRFLDKDIGTKQEDLVLEAIYKFEEFRKRPEKLNENFDLKQLSKLLALKSVFGSYEFDWKDLKFYFNPITKLLEPIGRELHQNESSEKIENWWSGDVFDKENIFDDQNAFLKLLFKNKEFYEIYLTDLNNFTSRDYIRDLIEENEKEFKYNLKLLKINYPTEKIFSKNFYDSVRKNIVSLLNPIQKINAYYLKYENDYIYFNIQNLQHLPIQLIKTQLPNKKILNFTDKIIIDGYNSKHSVKDNVVKLFCNIEDKSYCEKSSGQIQIYFNLVGSETIKNVDVSKFYSISKENFLKITNPTLNLENKKNSFIEFNEQKKEVYFNSKNIIINQEITIPKGYKFIVKAGSIIRFSDKGKLRSFSPINFQGTLNDPIIITSNYNFNEKSLVENYNSIDILNTDIKSFISHCIFENLIGPNKQSTEGITGVLNVYNSEILINDTIFKNNFQSDDFLNIVNSKFYLRNLTFENSFADAVDIDFSSGTIKDINILNSGNDALDFSGSKVDIENIVANNIGDKIISAGEQSYIKIINLKGKNSKVGLASKDLSILNVENFILDSGDIALTAYQKKTEFGPGKIISKKGDIFNYSNKFLSQLNSEIIFNDKLIENNKYDYNSL